LGTHPFSFGHADLTALGRYEYQRSRHTPATGSEAVGVVYRPSAVAATTVSQLPVPPGSPYGFEAPDWEYVVAEHRRANHLKVVLGLQFQSKHYVTTDLVNNVRLTFETAIAAYNLEPGHAPITLSVQQLRAGYGEHLFNQIARDIISADIAVFETSDHNPNVMIEIGVALTWGRRVFLIKKEGRPTPPSDISGQTWANYRDSAREFVNPEHIEMLVVMIGLAMRRKGSPGTV
jgi:hypothetical protein